ncbi:hypothetical protein ACJX0J_018610 [Zea mays]
MKHLFLMQSFYSMTLHTFNSVTRRVDNCAERVLFSRNLFFLSSGHAHHFVFYMHPCNILLAPVFTPTVFLINLTVNLLEYKQGYLSGKELNCLAVVGIQSLLAYIFSSTAMLFARALLYLPICFTTAHY